MSSKFGIMFLLFFSLSMASPTTNSLCAQWSSDRIRQYLNNILAGRANGDGTVYNSGFDMAPLECDQYNEEQIRRTVIEIVNTQIMDGMADEENGSETYLDCPQWSSDRIRQYVNNILAGKANRGGWDIATTSYSKCDQFNEEQIRRNVIKTLSESTEDLLQEQAPTRHVAPPASSPVPSPRVRPVCKKRDAWDLCMYEKRCTDWNHVDYFDYRRFFRTLKKEDWLSFRSVYVDKTGESVFHVYHDEDTNSWSCFACLPRNYTYNLGYDVESEIRCSSLGLPEIKQKKHFKKSCQDHEFTYGEFFSRYGMPDKMTVYSKDY